MKAATTTPMPRWLQSVASWCLGLIVVLMPLHAFISTWGGTAIGPLWVWKSWKDILLAIVAILITGWMVSAPRHWILLTRDVVFWLIISFIVLLSVLTLVFARTNGFEAAAAGFAMNSRYLLLFGLAYVLFRFGEFDWKKIRRMVGLWLIWAGTAVAAIGLLQIWVLPADFLAHFGYDKYKTIAPFVLIDENPNALRAFATLRGPNDFGAYLIAPLLMSCVFILKNRWFVLPAVVIFAGLYASGSRSAWAGATIALVVLAFMTYGRALLARKVVISGAALLIALVAVIVSATSIPAVRLALFHSSPGDSSLTEGSTDQHWVASAQGVSRIIDNPLGCGAGCAGPASYYSPEPRISENYYIQVAEEVGIIGLGIWLAITVTVAVRLWQLRADWLARGLFASLIGISAIGMWLHVWSDDPLSLTWWALAGITLGYYASASSKKAVL